MKRRHQVNRDLLPSREGRGHWRRVRLALAAAATLGMTGALAMPIVAVAPDDRQGSIPVAIDAINDPSFFSGAVLVDEYAPLAVFEGTGRQVAIDGRPVSMLNQDPAMAQAPGGNGSGAGPGQSSGPEGAPLLAGTVGRLGVLPGNLQLMHPVNTRRISSPYGWRKNPTGPGHQIHIGQDYPLACGSPVYAAEAGRVIVSGWRGHSGIRVTIDHGSNVHTGYSHNSRLLVSVGEQVAQGQLIALVGTTGNSTGCHLHFEVIINGRWHDPRNYLPLIPGQANAIVDSRRLTVKSNERPARNEETRAERPQPQPDPDVVTPKDDTPVVPKPEPAPSPKPTPVKSKSSSPTPAPTTKASTSPKPTAETKSSTKSPAPSTASPKPQSPAPSPTPTQTKSEPKPSPTPTESMTTPAPSPSPTESKTAPAPSPSPTESKPAPVTETTAPASPTPTVKETVAEKPRQAETTAPAEAEPETVKMETKKIIATEKEAATAPATESAAADAGEEEALAGTETGIEPARETEPAEQ